MTGYVIRQQDVQLFANDQRSEHFRSTLNSRLMPIEDVSGGWYRLAAGASNPVDVHAVDEVYFITAGTARFLLDGQAQRLNGKRAPRSFSSMRLTAR